MMNFGILPIFIGQQAQKVLFVVLKLLLVPLHAMVLLLETLQVLLITFPFVAANLLFKVHLRLIK